MGILSDEEETPMDKTLQDALSLIRENGGQIAQENCDHYLALKEAGYIEDAGLDDLWRPTVRLTDAGKEVGSAPKGTGETQGEEPYPWFTGFTWDQLSWNGPSSANIVQCDIEDGVVKVVMGVDYGVRDATPEGFAIMTPSYEITNAVKILSEPLQEARVFDLSPDAELFADLLYRALEVKPQDR